MKTDFKKLWKQKIKQIKRPFQNDFHPIMIRVRETKVCFSTNVDSNKRAVGSSENLGGRGGEQVKVV